MSKRLVFAALVLALAVAGVPSVGQTQFYTAQKIKEDCRAIEGELNHFEKGTCLGFIAGVHDAAAIQKLVCAPSTVTVGQVMDVVRKHFSDHPEHGHIVAADVVTYALSKVWPCK